jgi:hypothetical protein
MVAVAPLGDRIRSKDATKEALARTLTRAALNVLDERDHEFLLRSADGLRYCRTVKVFRDAVCGRYLARPNSCHVRVCPDCEAARAARLVERFDSLHWDMHRPVFVVLTIPNVPQGHLRDGLRIIRRALTNVRRTAVFANVRGGVTSIEAPWSEKSESWNVHANMLIDCPWILRRPLREAWRAATCNEIRRAERAAQGLTGRVPHCPHHHDSKGRSIDGCRGASMIGIERTYAAPGSPERTTAIREALKYATKGLDPHLPSVTPSVVAEAVLALRGQRLVSGWGTLWGVHDRDDAAAELTPETLTLAEVDGIPDLVGLPRICPFCGGEAMWDIPIEAPRAECIRAGPGALEWIPHVSGSAIA